jgi:hypothetical protein
MRGLVGHDCERLAKELRSLMYKPMYISLPGVVDEGPGRRHFASGNRLL